MIKRLKAFKVPLLVALFLLLVATVIVYADSASSPTTIKYGTIVLGSADPNGDGLTGDATTGVLQMRNSGGTLVEFTIAELEVLSAATDKAILYGNGTIWTKDVANFNWDDAANAQELTLGAGTSGGTISFLEPSGGGSSTVKLTAPALAGDIEFTLPIDDGTNGQVMKTDGSGVMSWASLAGFGVTTFNDLSIPYASGLDTFSFDETNFSWDDTTNSEVLSLGSGTSGGEIKLLEGSGGGTDGFSWTAPAALTGDYELEVPDGDGAVGQVMATDGSEVLVWTEIFNQLATNTAADIVEGNEGGANAFVFSGDGDLTWDASYFTAGRTSHVIMAGYVKSNDNNSETLDFTFLIGSTEFIGTGDLALAVEEEAGSPWIFECDIVGTGVDTQFATGTFTFMFNATTVATVIPFHKTLTETTANTALFSCTVEWKNGVVTEDQATMTMVMVDGVKF